MSPDELYIALDLPEQCAQDLRITKKDLLSNDAVALTAADKKAIRENVERVTWKFALTQTRQAYVPFGLRSGSMRGSRSWR